jgi:hypothetical protein
MPTAVESANILLKLYELRREPVLREARQWWLAEFTPETIEEFATMVTGERNPFYRMVAGYWDMAASFVTFGAVDPKMFRAANGEIMATTSRIFHLLPKIRERNKINEFYSHAEAFVRSQPDGLERMEMLRDQFLARKKKV